MGAWADGYFDNDDAADLLRDVGDARSWSVVRSGLSAAVDADYLEAPEASRAVAAAAILAASLRGGAALLPDQEAPLATALGPPPEALTALALKALAKVVNGSELEALHAEGTGETYDSWLNGISALRNLLGGLA
jgi:hypothetical protein